MLEGPALADVAADIARARAGRRLVVVHGGGPQATALARRLGIESRIVGGRRVTDEPTLDVMKMVVGGQAQRRSGARRCAAPACPAFGVSGASGVIRAHRRPPRVVSGAGDTPIDFGLVGDVDGFDVELLDALDAARRAAGDRLPGRRHRRRRCSTSTPTSSPASSPPRWAPARWSRARRWAACAATRTIPPTRLPRLTVAEAQGRDRRRHRAGRHDPEAGGGVRAARRPASAPCTSSRPTEIATSLAAPGSVGTLLVP